MRTNGGKINKLLIILFIQSFIAIPANGMFVGNKGSSVLQRKLAKQMMQKPNQVAIDCYGRCYSSRNSSRKIFHHKFSFSSVRFLKCASLGFGFVGTSILIYKFSNAIGTMFAKILIENHKTNKRIDEIYKSIDSNGHYSKYKYKNECKKLNQQLLKEKTLREQELEKNITLRNHIKTNNHNNALAVAAIAAVIPITVMVNLFKEYL